MMVVVDYYCSLWCCLGLLFVHDHAVWEILLLFLLLCTPNHTCGWSFCVVEERKGERQQKTQDNTFPPAPANQNAWPLEFEQFER